MSSVHQTTPEQIRRLKLLMTLVWGACVPILGNLLFHTWAQLYAGGSEGVTWHQYAGYLSPIVLVVVTMVVCYRGLHRSSLPGVAAVLSLTGLILAMALLNRG